MQWAKGTNPPRHGLAWQPHGGSSTPGLTSAQHKATPTASHSKAVAMVTRYKRQSCCFPVARGIPGTWSKHARQRNWYKKEEGKEKTKMTMYFDFHIHGLRWSEQQKSWEASEGKKETVGESEGKLKTFFKSQKLHKHHLLMQENAKCHVQQAQAEKRL